jgi:uncharacterized protein GlcG (DUF336 family)
MQAGHREIDQIHHRNITTAQKAHDMTGLSLTHAQTILTAALTHAREAGFKPLAVAIMDARGALKCFAAEDATSLKRGDIAMAKASGSIALGIGSRSIAKMAAERPAFVAAVSHVVGGALIPVAGGVLIRDASGALLGAVGISGDTSDNDEAAAIAGIMAAGLAGDAGA